MSFRSLLSTCLVATIAVSGANRAEADADAVVGALVGGIIGHAIAKDQERKRVVRQAPRTSSAQRQANRDMQTALNYFGFNAGAVDGAVGPGTRGAVSRYQRHMGYPASGWIQPHERDFLMAAYHWASSGGAATAGATTPQNLLIKYRAALAQPTPTPTPAPPSTSWSASSTSPLSRASDSGTSSIRCSGSGRSRARSVYSRLDKIR